MCVLSENTIGPVTGCVINATDIDSGLNGRFTYRISKVCLIFVILLDKLNLVFSNCIHDISKLHFPILNIVKQYSQ